MIPLIPTFAFAFVSFICSAFVILRIVIPILPPSPLSRRVPPSEFGLPNLRTLSLTDKNHLWLAACDLLALTVFVTQAVFESLGGPSDYAEASDPGSAVRLWLALTVRQTCLLVVAIITLLHVRMGHSVSLGSKHWILWAPTLFITVASTAVAGVLAGAGSNTFFSGIVCYSAAVAVITSIAFIWLIATLVVIKRNLGAHNQSADSWPPVRMVEEKRRPSFATEDIDAMKDGSSWVTSNVSSRRDSISNWSFSTHTNRVSRYGSLRAQNPATAFHPSIPAKSSYRFNLAIPFERKSDVPSVPPLPSPYCPASVASTIPYNDPGPFGCEALSQHLRAYPDSQGSWLTSPSGSEVTLSRWSYPTTRPNASSGALDLRPDMLPAAPPSRPSTPAMANAQVLGSYNPGYAPGDTEAEEALASFAVANGSEIDVSFYRVIGWLIAIWVPLGFALPYFFLVSSSGPTPLSVNILLSLSVAISSPILAFNILFRSPLPIPVGLFDAHAESSPTTQAARPQRTSLDCREYKRSGSVTLVEGRRSGDIWLSNGDAVDGKGKFGRAMGMLATMPKLSVLPPEVHDDNGEITPPLGLQMDDSPGFDAPTPQLQNSAELGRMRPLASSHHSACDESFAHATRNMIAQSHYSTLAQTFMVPGPSEHKPSGGDASGAAIDQPIKGYLRARSISCPSRPQTIAPAPTPLPSLSLPPTPPSIKNARHVKMGHKKAHSSGAFSLSALNDINEIDAMTAWLIPGLVPGLKVGSDMKIRDSISRAGTFNTAREKKRSSEFGALGVTGEFSSPELHSTPAWRKEARSRKIPGHKRNHYRLSSLGLGKEGGLSLAMWKAELNRALEGQVSKYAAVSNGDLVRPATVGGELPPNKASLNAVREEEVRATVLAVPSKAHLGRSRSTRSLGLHIDVPVQVNSTHESLVTLSSNTIPPSPASTMTLFEFEAGFGPQAESTPHDDQKKHPTKKKVHPRNPLPTPHHHRSSIVYIKSDDDPSTNPIISPQSFSRAVRQLVPKRNILQRNSSSDTKSGSPGWGLRPLSLLQDHDTNRQMTSPGKTWPLHLGKKKQQLKTTHDDENTAPQAIPKNRNLKQLQPVRSETSKQ